MRRALILALLLAASSAIAAPTAVKLKLTTTINGIPTDTTSAAASLPADNGKVPVASNTASAGIVWTAPSALTAGAASTVTFADAGGDTTTFCALGTAATGALAPATDAGCTYNATTDVFSVSGGFAGPLVGNVTGNVSGSAATVTTNANLTGPITSSGNATTVADAELACIAGQTSAANKLSVWTGSGTCGLVDFTPAGFSFVLSANSTIGGTNTGDQTTVSGNAGTATALAANGANCSAGQFPLGVDASGAVETCTALPTTITGTANQVVASGSTGAITLSLPQSIATSSGPQFATIELGAASDTTLARSGAGAMTVEGAAVLLSGGALGTPSSGVATNLTGTAAGLTAGVASAVAVGGVTGLGSNVGTWLATPTNANFLAAITGESGTSGAVVLVDSPYVRTCKYTTSDQTLIGTSYVDVTGLTISVAASTNYKIEGGVWIDSDAATTGIDIALNGPASPTAISYEQFVWLTGGPLSIHATTYDSNSASPSSSGATARMYRLDGTLQNGSNAGTLAVRTKREAVGTGPNARTGSWLCIQQIT